LKGVIIIEGHVQGLSNVRALGELGIPVWVIDTGKCLAQYSKYCHFFLQCPNYSSDEFILFLEEIAINHDLKGWLLLPSNDHAVFSISTHREKLVKHYQLITDEIDTINKIYNKLELLNLAIALKIPVPSFEQLEHPHAPVNLTFPILTKGNNGLNFYKKMKRKVIVSVNSVELVKNLNSIQKRISLSETFMQELIPYHKKNKTISFTAFAVKGIIKTYWIGQKLREHPLRFGTATMAESISDPGVLIYGSQLLKALNYTGICEIEFLKDERDQQYKLIEMNARSWLWVDLAKECGVNYAKIAYDFSQSRLIDFPTNYTFNTVWYNPITNFYFTIKGLFLGKIAISEIWMNRGKVKVNALFKKKDPKPFWMYIILGTKFLQKR
jgi:predicted ATP-grasp superfamily ATP-dependent carboligase